MMYKVKDLAHRSPVFQHILTLMSGTAVSQVATTILAIFLARMFTTEDFGRIAVYNSVVAMIVAIASLRYDMTMMIAKTDVEARVLKKLATRSIITVSIISSLVGITLQDRITAHYGNDPQIGQLFPYLGITVFLISEVAVLQYWYNRQSNYKRIAINRVQQTVGTSVGQLAIGGVGLKNAFGLFLGTTLGQAYAWVNLGLRAKELREPLPKDAPRMRDLARRYIKMPLLNGPNAILDAVRLSGINLLISTESFGTVGQFNMAWRMLQLPVGLITGAVSQVFFQKLSTVERGNMEKMVKFVVARAFLAGLVPFTLLFIISPWIFPFVFGAQWADSGDFARALTPWLMLMVVTSPISTVFIVTERQFVVLVFATFYCVVPLSILYFSPWSLLATVYLLGAAMAFLLLINIVLAIWVAKQYDQGVGLREADRMS